MSSFVISVPISLDVNVGQAIFKALQIPNKRGIENSLLCNSKL